MEIIVEGAVDGHLEDFAQRVRGSKDVRSQATRIWSLLLPGLQKDHGGITLVDGYGLGQMTSRRPSALLPDWPTLAWRAQALGRQDDST